MYAFYSLLIYIFYSLFRRDGGATATTDPGDPAQRVHCKPRGRRRPDQLSPELWTELTGLAAGSSESEDGPEGGAEDRPAEVSLEEALMRLAEFLSVHLGAEESCGNPELGKPGEVPPLLTVTSQLLALLAWIRSPRGRQVLLQGTHPASNVQPPIPDGALSQEDSPYQPTPIQGEVPRGEAQGQQLPQLEEEQRAWQRLEQLILGQLEELRQQLEQQEEELGRLRLGVGATDSEKRVQHLTLENEALKQSLSLTRDLLLHWGPGPPTRAPQEEAEALLELQGRLQEAQDTTEALRVQLGVQEVQLQGLRGALQQLQQETEQNCRRELQQVHGQLAGLRTRMASLRQGCGDLRGLVSTFTQSCQGSLSEAQGQVFGELEPAVLSCLQGYSVCIFTYGQTGTGKTYSMEGPPEDPGIAPRALQSLFREMGTGGQHRVTLSMVEIYNEAVRDLLAPGPPERLAVRQGPAGQGGIQVAGLTHWDVPNLETLHQMLSLGRSNRATAATSMNPRSSRSHALVTLTLCAASPPSAPGTAGTLHLVDLAGSERAWKAGATGTQRGDPNSAQRLREAQTINRSLLALGGVMAALRARRSHIPFRDSQLTRLLQPALGPGTTAVLLLQISTRPEDIGETVCSLKFAERVGQVELGPARRRKAPRSETPSSLSTDTPLTGTPCTPTRSPVSPPSPSPDSGSCSALGPSGDLPP
ncbi:kinesin family member C2, transcript variant X4 [Ictidomys tridecemlineatus]|uniref:kinesin-like protein KIFC2 isoform X3 n=1 Tax=Ictidomys tridecemlineatus TaxID=43179 RepID=UPI00068059E3|nr:kinesin-like protein KIFC2 isoform X3 [Ictidomys tridecemlineatus]KAG3273348.1 kinesin family member C2, transcript variant X4 [Ictidomys tridecemlineatus]